MTQELKAGDRVRVVRNYSHKDFGWVKPMDKWVNDGLEHEVVVVDEDHPHDIYLRHAINTGEQWNFPIEALERVEAPVELSATWEVIEDEAPENVDPLVEQRRALKRMLGF